MGYLQAVPAILHGGPGGDINGSGLMGIFKCRAKAYFHFQAAHEAYYYSHFQNHSADLFA